MTASGTVAGQRYLLQEPNGREGAAERWVGFDERLNRAVTVWLVERDESHPDRIALLALARSIARAPQPAFLAVLDIVPERDRLSIVLELPDAPEGLAIDALRLPAPAAVRTVLDLAQSLHAAEVAGLELRRLPQAYVHAEAQGELRADPIALFLPTDRDRPPSAAPLVGVLDQIIDDDAPLRISDFDRAIDDDVRALIDRWDRHDGDLTELIEDLRDIAGVPSGTPMPAPVSARAYPEEIEITAELEVWPPPSTPGRRRVADGERQVPWHVAVPVAAAVLALLLGITGLVIATQAGFNPGSLAPGTDSNSGVPISTPATGRVTVGVQAQEETNVRVTIDGVVQFNGTLSSGDRRLWEGTERIQVWTDRGQTLLLSVNGHDLGPYSPAMGAIQGDAEIAGWNRIDFGFWPGWAP